MSLKLKVLNSVSAKAQGVIGREALDDDEVFVFPDTYEGAGFHMRGVPFDIAIAFLDRDFGILSIERMAAETGAAYAPPCSVLAVEAAVGYFEQQELKPDMHWQELWNCSERGELDAHLRI